MAREGEGDECSNQEQFISEWVEYFTERSPLIEGPGDESVESVGESGGEKDRQGRQEALIADRRDEDRDQNQPEGGQQVGSGKYRSHNCKE